MKTRNGFVSNSSSSSFLLLFSEEENGYMFCASKEDIVNADVPIWIFIRSIGNSGAVSNVIFPLDTEEAKDYALAYIWDNQEITVDFLHGVLFVFPDCDIPAGFSTEKELNGLQLDVDYRGYLKTFSEFKDKYEYWYNRLKGDTNEN